MIPASQRWNSQVSTGNSVTMHGSPFPRGAEAFPRSLSYDPEIDGDLRVELLKRISVSTTLKWWVGSGRVVMAFADGAVPGRSVG